VSRRGRYPHYLTVVLFANCSFAGAFEIAREPMIRPAYFVLCAALFLPTALPAQEAAKPDPQAILKDKPLARWIDDLKATDGNVRLKGIQVLEQLGPIAREAEPALLAALKEARANQQQQILIGPIATTLKTIGADPKPAVAALVPLLKPNTWGLDPNAFAILKVGGTTEQETVAVRTLLLGHLRCSSSALLAQPEIMKQYAGKIMPALIIFLKDSDPRCRDLASAALAYYGKQAEKYAPALVEMLADKEMPARIRAAVALVAVDPGQKQKVITVLVAALDKPDAVSLAGPALSQMGVDAIPYLLPHLREKTGKEQQPYIQTLAAMGPPAVTALVKELSGRTVAGRLGAAHALRFMTYQARPAFDNLVAALNDQDAEVRFYAAMALVWIDASKAAPAVPNLIAGLESANQTIRYEAVASLSQVGKPAVAGLPGLRKFLQDPSLGLRAALAMANIDPTQAAEAVPVLTASLEAGTTKFPYAQIDALKRIGAPAAAAAPALRKLLSAKEGHLRVCAAAALARVSPENVPEAVKALLAVLQDEPYENPALISLGEIGPAAKEAIPYLKKVVADQKAGGDVKNDALAALLRIDPSEVAGVLPKIKEDLQSQKPHVFREAVELLCAAAPARPEEVVPLLAGVLKDKRARHLWSEVLETLGNLGPAARAAVPMLEERLKDAGAGEVQPIKDTLAKIKPAKGASIPK
jgi:HEAT repeat protein